MPEHYSVQYFMVCDDVRVERSGKEIIIGVYNDTLISSVFPFMMPQICFRVSVRHTKLLDTFSVALKRPDGENLFSHTGKITHQNILEQTVLNIQLGGFQFPVPGRYTFWLGLDQQ